MYSYDWEAITYDGAAYCLNHIPKGIGKDETTPIFADSEWDSYPSCDKCRKVFDYVSLTNTNQKGESDDEIQKTTRTAIKLSR